MDDVSGLKYQPNPFGDIMPITVFWEGSKAGCPICVHTPNWPILTQNTLWPNGEWVGLQSMVPVACGRARPPMCRLRRAEPSAADPSRVEPSPGTRVEYVQSSWPPPPLLCALAHGVAGGRDRGASASLNGPVQLPSCDAYIRT